MPRPFALSRRDSGFTLIEALVVLAVVGLIAGLVYPAIERARAALAQRQMRTQSLNTVIAARAQALRTGRGVVLAAAGDGGALTMAGQPVSAIAPVRVTVDPTQIRFMPDGSVSGGRIGLISDAGETAIMIAPDTGAVSIREARGATAR